MIHHSRVRFPTWLGWILVAVAILIVTVGTVVINRHTKDLVGRAESQLQSITQLKSSQIVQWRKERLDEATGLASSPSLCVAYRDVITNGSVTAKATVLRDFAYSQRAEYFSAISLVDTRGAIRLSTNSKVHVLPENVIHEVMASVANRSALVGELTAHPGESVPHIHAVAPITATDGKSIVGAVVMSTRASDFLYPMINHWPLPSQSAETLLVRRQGDRVLFLNDLRFRKNTALRFSAPLSTPNLPAAKAVSGFEGVFQGRDYRGIDVLCASIKVPGSNWYIVAKVDSSEALQYERYTTVLLCLLVAGMLVVIVAIAITSWFSVKDSYYRNALETEQHKRALADHYRAQLQNASDIFILVDSERHIIEVNDLALQTYGYSRDQMIGMDYEHLVEESELEAYRQRKGTVVSENTTLFTGLHTRSSGEIFDIEGTEREISIDNAMYSQMIIRDTTQRVQERRALERSEQLFREFMDHLPGMAFVQDQSGDFIYANAALCDLLGIDPNHFEQLATVKDHLLFPLIHSSDDQQILINQNSRLFTELQYTHDSQHKHYMLGRFIIRQSDGANLIGGIMLDVTQHRQAERDLQRITLMYATLSQINESIMRATDANNLYDAVCKIAVNYGKSTLAWIGLLDEHTKSINMVAISGAPSEYVNIILAPSSGFMASLDPSFVAIKEKRAVYANHLAIEAFSPGEILLQKQGIHSAAAFPIVKSGEVIGVCAFYQQDADFYQEQECKLLDEIGLNISYALDVIDKHEQQRQLEDIIIHSPVMAFRRLNTQGWPVVYTSDNITQLGYEPSYFDGNRSYASIIHPDDLNRVETMWQAFLSSNNTIHTSSYRIIDTAGTARWVEERSWVEDMGESIPQYVMSIVTDISPQKLAEQEQYESQQRYRVIFENLRTVMLIIDLETGQIVDANPSAADFYGWSHEQLLAMRISDINTRPADQIRDDIHKAAAQERTYFRFEHRLADGKTRDVEVLSTPTTIQGKTMLLSIIHDVTDKMNEEEQRIRDEQRRVQSLKMETLGRLSSGIAHDFNNLLTVITGFVDIMMEKTDSQYPFYSELSEVKHASEQAASLTKQLLAFSRKQTLERKSADINKLVTASQKMISRLIGEDINVEIILSNEPLVASIDDGQIKQVLLNLATNARDAMPQGGSLRLVTDTVTITDEDVSFGPEATAGDYVKVTVADTGTGMDEQTVSRIFEPFYTTKEQGKGTGLGLATCYGIMKQHDGWISASSTEGSGTEFHLYFPIIRVVQGDTTEKRSTPSIPRGHGERVLLVEDELAVQRMSIKVLQRYAYTVVPASDGVEALDIYINDPTGFALVLSDVVMPNMDGLTLINHILEINPGQKIIMNSGYTDEKVDWSGIETRKITFLHKPFTVEKLITTVHDVLADA